MQDKADMEVVKVPKSGGTVAVSREQKRIIRDRHIHQYFYGMEFDLQPTLHYISLDKVTICKVATSASAQQGVLPSGMQHSVDGTRLMKLEPSQDMVRANKPIFLQLRRFRAGMLHVFLLCVGHRICPLERAALSRSCDSRLHPMTTLICI